MLDHRKLFVSNNICYNKNTLLLKLSYVAIAQPFTIVYPKKSYGDWIRIPMIYHDILANA